jgi:hypothetical protein
VSSPRPAVCTSASFADQDSAPPGYVDLEQDSIGQCTINPAASSDLTKCTARMEQFKLCEHPSIGCSIAINHGNAMAVDHGDNCLSTHWRVATTRFFDYWCDGAGSGA